MPERIQQNAENYIKIPSREKLLEEVRQTLVDATSPTLVILDGLSGTGKSNLGRYATRGHLLGNIEVLDGYISEPSYYIKKERRTNYLSLSTPRESELLRQSLHRYPYLQVKEFVVKGLDEKESQKFLSKRKVKSFLDSKQIVQLSLGLPELLTIFSGLETLTPEIANSIASRYVRSLILAEDFFKYPQKTIEKYLNIIPSTALLEKARSYDPFEGGRDLYEHIMNIKKHVEFYGVNDKVDLNTAIFVAPQSVEIYNKSLSDKGKGNPQVEIFVPDIPLEHQFEMMEVLE